MPFPLPTDISSYTSSRCVLFPAELSYPCSQHLSFTTAASSFLPLPARFWAVSSLHLSKYYVAHSRLHGSSTMGSSLWTQTGDGFTQREKDLLFFENLAEMTHIPYIYSFLLEIQAFKSKLRCLMSCFSTWLCPLHILLFLSQVTTLAFKPSFSGHYSSLSLNSSPTSQ